MSNSDILDAMRTVGRPVSPSELAAHMRARLNTINSRLSKLVAYGVIQRTVVAGPYLHRRFAYSLKPDAKA